MSTEEFIERARKVHGDKYNYSMVNYVNARTKICIICPEHGEFYQLPGSHLNGKGCKKCRDKVFSLGITNFIEKSNIVHNCKYDYSKVNYVNNRTKVCIICPEHGEFWQTPEAHLRGQGCYKCSLIINGIKRRSTKEKFIKKAKEVHGDKYDYSKVEYVNANTKVCIMCPVHGEFWQSPSNHLKHNGCPLCNESKLESAIKLFLIKNNICFYQKADKKVFNWLETQHLDFYLPDYNVAIECQGEQHFRKIKRFGGEEKLIKDVFRDEKKYNKCINNGVNIIYIFPNKKVNENISKIYSNAKVLKIKEKII